MDRITTQFLEQNQKQAEVFAAAIDGHARADESLKAEVGNLRTDVGRVLEAVRD